MSLLGSQVFANKDKACWVPNGAGNGTIGGNLQVNGNLTVSGANTGVQGLSATSVICSGLLTGIGPQTTIVISPAAPGTINLPAGSASRTANFTMTPPVVPVQNGEYDCQFLGSIVWDGTGVAPAAGDTIFLSISCSAGVAGTARSPLNYPGDAPFTWVANVPVYFTLRARIAAFPFPAATITAGFTFQGAAATGNFVGTCTLFDVVRVA